MTPTQKELLAEVERRVADSIMEPGTAELIRKLIVRADNDDEAIKVMQLGTTYKRTGLHFDHRLERTTSDIHYLRRNEALSFHTDDSKPVHRLIIGDNYPALQNLLVQYRSKVDVIYIDPPYGKDSMGEFAKTNYENALTRDNLLSMLWPRLQLAKMLLSDSGVILCSIDDRNQAYVKCLFDEVFGERNFVANFIWKSRQNKDNRNITGVSIDHEYVVCYSKQNVERIFRGSERKENQYSNPDNDPRGPWASSNMSGLLDESQRPNCHYDLINPYTGVNYGKPQMGWRYDKNTMTKLIEDNRIIWPDKIGGRPRRKTFLSEVSNLLPGFSSIIGEKIYTRAGTKQLDEIFSERIFGFPKPMELLVGLFDQVTANDSIILDFFAGSGTTGHAVLELNRQEAEAGNLLKERKPEGRRQFILVQLDEKTDTTPGGIARDVTAERLRRIMTGKASDGSSDFDWLKKHRPYGGNLEVLELATVADFEHTEGKTPADVIDETLYGLPPFTHLRDKMDWLCTHFPQTQKSLD